MSTSTATSPTRDALSSRAIDFASAAASAAAAVLPSVEPLAAGTPMAGPDDLRTAFVGAGLAGAAIAELEGPTGGAVAVLVGSELVAALSGSPLGGLDLATAVQPALDAAAAALDRSAGPARTVDLALVTGDLKGAYAAVPLLGSNVSAAVLVTMTALDHAAPAPAPASRGGVPGMRGLEMLHGVILDVTVELGRTRMSVRELLSLTPGTVLELDRAAGSPADLLVNGRIIARGEVVVVDEDFGLRITEIVDDAVAM